MDWKFVRNWLVVGVIMGSIWIALYCSVPDFPYQCPAWGFLLWGEASQWWSEMTWIGAFCILSVMVLFIWSWAGELPQDKQERFYQLAFRGIWGVAYGSIMFHYTAFYFSWTQWPEWFFKDDTGYLHGFFYMTTFFLGILVCEELLSYLSRLHGAMVHVNGGPKA